MRTMHAADQRTHVSSGAGPGDDDDVALESISIEAGGIEKIARATDDALAWEEHDVKGHKQAGGADQRAAERNADRAGAGNSCEGFGNADSGGGKLFFVGFQDHARKSMRAGKNLRREELNFAHDDVFQTVTSGFDGAADGEWSALDTPDAGGGIDLILFEDSGEIWHDDWNCILCSGRHRLSTLATAGRAFPCPAGSAGERL